MESNHRDWVEGVFRLLLEREGCTVMVLIHNPNGIEIVNNYQDMTEQLGMLRSATVITEADFKESLSEWRKTGRAQAMATDAVRIMEGKETLKN